MQVLQNRLQLKDFRLIRAIYETGQLAIAAERMSLTQPAASRMLASIERMVGMTLFVRHPKGMTATPAGEILARNAAGLLNGLEQTLQEVTAVTSGKSGSVRVGSVTGGAVAFVVPAIQKLKANTGSADIYVDVAPSDVLIQGLIDGEYDFVLSRLPPGTDSRQFNILTGRVEIIRFLVREGHPLAGRKKLRLGDLSDYEWLMQAPRTPMRHAIEEAFLSQGLPSPQETVNTTSMLVMISYLTTSDAIAPITQEVVELLGPKVFGGRVAALDVTDSVVVTPYHLISRKHQLMSPLATRLRELVFAGLASGRHRE
ncbi:LysR family transcriptional regulator [Rhizobium sp. C4]|uniref:LysR family transcriptional regulator n=1 Tax=Rhizobium sp. C4 TaxID=1349800 RepID=UPI001E65C557|nr:LysR family transcriptional regulator [Rhizobium sp. C4]MCD2173517.1 LysR family transcriptional regulator [Rhizobium sp. C4]